MSYFDGYQVHDVMRAKQIIEQEAAREIAKKKTLLMPTFFKRMDEEHLIPYKLTFGICKVLKFIHPDVEYETFMERNGLFEGE